MSQATARFAGYINPLRTVAPRGREPPGKEKEKEYIKWVEFHVTASVEPGLPV